MCRWGIPGGLSALPPELFRLIWQEAMAAEYLSKHMQNFICHELLQPIEHFFRHGCHLDTENFPIKRGWSVVTDFFAEHVAEIERIKVLRGLRDRIPSSPSQMHVFPQAIRLLEYGPFRFEALETEKAIQVEGAQMHHCIGTMSERLSNEMLVAYSVQDRKTHQRS
jgi:hypothetical protein